MLRATFLNRLIGIAGLGFLPVSKIEATQKIYLLQSFVAGFRFHKGMDLLQHLQEGDLIELRREPANEHDPFAVALYWQQEMIGYLPAASNETLARLIDASVLHLVATITHLAKTAKLWENVAIAVYFLQPEQPLQPEAGYLTTLKPPTYSTATTYCKEEVLPELFDYYDRVINLDGIADEGVKAYFEESFGKYPVDIEDGHFVHAKHDGVYTYLYELESSGWVWDRKGVRWLEFIWEG